MSDLTVNSSTTFANALNAISGVTSDSTSTEATSSSSSSSSSLMSEFSTIMMIMLLGSMSSSSSSDSDSSSMGMNMNQLMAPLMLTLLEKLTSSQVEEDEATVNDVSETKKSIDSSSTKPDGWPASGPVTQGSHAGHVAIDIGVSVGTKIKSTMSGEVIYAGWNNEGYGNLVIVKNGKFMTYYAHLSKIPVSAGDKVNAGEVIGLSGNTGNSTGPHLHYEVRVNGATVDPIKYM